MLGRLFWVMFERRTKDWLQSPRNLLGTVLLSIGVGTANHSTVDRKLSRRG